MWVTRENCILSCVPPPLRVISFRIWDSSTKVPNYVYPLSPEGPEALTWDGYILAVSGSIVTNIVIIQPFVTDTAICYCNKYQDRQVIKRKGSFWLTVLKVPVVWGLCLHFLMAVCR